jgi:hypothetical protein
MECVRDEAKRFTGDFGVEIRTPAERRVEEAGISSGRGGEALQQCLSGFG